MPANLISGKKQTKSKFSKYANPTFITKGDNLLTGVVKSDFGKTAYYDTEQTIPNFYTPELTPETWLLPRSRAEILRWCRLFFNLDPYINSILTMHAQYPISNFRLSYKDKDTEAFFNRKLFDNKEFSWIDFLEQVMLSYFKMGEAVVWADWSESKGTWNGFSLIDPSLIEYKEDPISGEVEMSIIPTRELKQMLADGLKQGRTDIPVEYIRCVQENQKIPLDATGTEPNYLTGKKYSPAKVFMLARKTDPGATRGTPITQCARYSTRIKLLDGTTKCIGDLYKDGATDFWVYSIDDNGNITPKKASKVIYQGKKFTYDITLDNGEVLGFTEDHPFLMRDGSWKEVKDLKPGDSLMPLYTRDKKIGNGMYEQVYSPVNDSWEFTHRLVELPGKFKGCVIHHKNFDKRDNRPENLLVTTFDDHIKLHKYLLEKSKDKRLEGLKKYRNTPKFEENRKKQSLCASVFMREVWKSEEYREKQKRYSESRKKALLKTMSSPKYKEAMIKGQNKSLDTWYSLDSKYSEIKNLSNGYISVCGGKSTARHYRHMVKFLGLDLGVIAHNGKTYIYNKTVDISKVIEEDCVMQSTSCVLGSILKDVSKILSNDDIDYVVLENEKYGINSLSKAKSISKLLKSRFSTIGISYLSYFGTTVIYKPVAKDLVDLFRKNNYMLGYDSISKNRATDSIDCNSILADMLYSQESSIKEIKYTRSILRQLKSYVKRNNLPINISKKGDKIIISRVWNHKVVSVVPAQFEDVYDIECVDGTHNFAVACEDGSGVFVHNCLFKTLIYQDKIKLAQIACADRLHLPIEIWTIGSYTGDPQTSIIPDDSMIGEVREAIRQATMQPPFSIFVPPYIKYEAVGVNGKLLSVYEDLGYVENCIFVGLGVNKNLILGAGPSFSSSKQTSLFKLIKMYKMLRLKLEAFIKRYILLPIARANDIKDEYGDYVVPNIEWEESLQPEQDVEKFNNVLKLWDKGLVSTTTVYEYFPGKLDINLEKQRLEMERGSIWDKGTDRLGSKAQRPDLNEKKPDTGNKPSMPTPSDGSKPAEGLPPPMGGDVEEGGEPESTEVPAAPEEVPAEQ